VEPLQELLPYDECTGFEYFEEYLNYKFAYATSIAIGFLGIWVFNRYYQRKYIHPKA